jgi:hypothetical protein
LMSIRSQLRSGNVIVLEDMQSELGEMQYVATV